MIYQFGLCFAIFWETKDQWADFEMATPKEIVKLVKFQLSFGLWF